MNVLLTGSTGFVGSALALKIRSMPSLRLTVAVRAPQSNPQPVQHHVVGDLSATTDWSSAVAGQEVVIHAAARAHVLAETTADPMATFRSVNVDGTIKLARQAAAAGVKRIVFISSIGVNGAETKEKPFTADDVAAPHSNYALSKLAAEIGLQALARETGMDVVIIRPPLVYGLNAPGNFGSLVRWVSRSLPLPLGAVTANRRSLVGLDNLVDLILTCIDHPYAANQTFLVSDGDDLSTADLLLRIGKALNRPARLLPVPASVMNAVLGALGKKSIAQSLLGSLQIDIGKTRALLGWTPPLSVDDGLRRAVAQRP